MEAAKTTAKIALDGLLDEVNWQAAPLIADFFRMKPKQGGNYDFLTTVRLLFNNETKDNDWDALWFVKTKILENGWSVEFAIPFKSLRYELPKAGEAVSWGFTASRFAHRTDEQRVFPPTPKAFSPYRMTYAAPWKVWNFPNQP